jgi:hypothetical protein
MGLRADLGELENRECLVIRGTQSFFVVVQHVDHQLHPSAKAYTTAHKSVSVTAFKDVVLYVGIGTNLLLMHLVYQQSVRHIEPLCLLTEDEKKFGRLNKYC